MFTLIIFYVLSVALIFSCVMVVASRNPVNSVLYLIVAFFSISGHYVLLNAQFLAVVNIIVYAGAIMVLFLFTVMLLNLNKETEPRKPVIWKVLAVSTGCLLALVMVGAMKGADVQAAADPSFNQIGLVKQLGRVLFDKFMFPFEAASVLFMTAMVGALMLGKKELKD